MAGDIGVGSALRRAREIRGITVDEACRDTKLHPDQLSALEGEEFDQIGGEVYVRAQLRTYAQYLGLRPEKVLGAYSRHRHDPSPPAPPSGMGKVERAIAATRIRDNQRFLLIAAAVVLSSLIAVGLVSKGGAPEATTTVPNTAALGSPSDPPAGTVDITIVAVDEVEVSAVVDGVPREAIVLRPGEVISFSGTTDVTVRASDGGLVDVTVNGEDLGAPGPAGASWTDSWTVEGGGTASPT